MKGGNSNRWFVLCLKNVVKLMIFHGDLLVATSHSGGPLCGVPWKPYPLRRSLLLRQHLQSLVAGSAKGKSYQYPRGKPTSIWENQGKSTNVIQYVSRESHWFPYCFLDLLEGSCGLVKSGEAQVLKSFNHQKSFHRVWDVYDEMIREKAGNATAPPPSKKGGAEDIIVVSVIRKSWKNRSARVTLLMTPHIHCKCI